MAVMRLSNEQPDSLTYICPRLKITSARGGGGGGGGVLEEGSPNTTVVGGQS